MTTPSSYDIVLAGKGGQGVLFLSRVVGEAGLREGIGVRTTETHGMAMRGGSVLCFVRIGKGMGPLFRKGMASLLMALHEDEAALGRVYLAQDNPAIINTRDSKGSVNDLIVDADSLAASVGNPRSANLALLGAATTIGSFDPGDGNGQVSVREPGDLSAWKRKSNVQSPAPKGKTLTT
jgi:indolepyruvate ferredoxin oxidoreductase beta subunit